MQDAAKDFFVRLLETPSPSGYEEPVQELVREYCEAFADSVTTDLHGNVIVGCNPTAERRILLAGHCDQIGLLVSFIDENGYLYSQTVGGWDPQQLIGQRMTIWTADGPLPGVIARKPIHLLTPEERKKVVLAKELWIDIGAKSKEEAAELVRIGDPATLALGYQELRNGLANAPKMDNTTGLWVVLEAARRAQESGGLSCGLFAVSTVQEEIGLRGAKTSAFGVDPEIGVAVDVTHATDCPTITKFQEGEISLGGGPVIVRGPNMNPRITDLLIRTAEAEEIDYQLAAVARATPNDANSIQITRSGVATGLVSIPNRYMHSAVETISLEDIDRAADLLAAFALSIDDEQSFVP